MVEAIKNSDHLNYQKKYDVLRLIRDDILTKRENRLQGLIKDWVALEARLDQSSISPCNSVYTLNGLPKKSDSLLLYSITCITLDAISMAFGIGLTMAAPHWKGSIAA